MKLNSKSPNPRITSSLYVLLVYVVGIGFTGFSANDVSAQSAGTPSSQLTDRYFPPEMTEWMQDKTRLAEGVQEAEQLRAKIIATSSEEAEAQPPLAHFICEHVARFQIEVREQNAFDESIASFQMTEDRLLEQLSGQITISTTAFDAFNGRWFGRWGSSEVNHDWAPAVRFDPLKRLLPEQPPVSALQYAWISNGFGWNYLMANGDAAEQNWILGMVYYLDDSNYKRITESKAHVGFADNPTRLIWITEREIFLEEAFPATQVQPERYAITAMYHNLFSSQPSMDGRSAQAIYTREPGNRPAFREFQWSPQQLIKH
jgi:hypothetical protein